MAYTTINKSTDYFNTKLYTGNGTNATGITGVGFQPDWVWLKERSSTSPHKLLDAVRGATKELESSSNALEQTESTSLQSFDSDGFTVGTNGAVNENSQTYAAWNWKANGSGSSNTDGDITSTVSANTTSGFSIVKYTGNGSNDQRIGHGLGARPTMWMIKRLTGGAADWIVYHQGLASNWYDDTYLYLNSTDSAMGAVNTGTGNPTSSVFYIGNDNRTGGNTFEYIAYVFAEKKGFSKFGSYIGNASSDGPFIYTGFKPAFLMVKRTDSTSDWLICDNKRNNHSITYPTNNINPVNGKIFANLNQIEEFYNSFDFLSNGFKIKTSGTGHNASGANMIYMAFGQSLVGSNNVPCTAR